MKPTELGNVKNKLESLKNEECGERSKLSQIQGNLWPDYAAFVEDPTIDAVGLGKPGMNILEELSEKNLSEIRNLIGVETEESALENSSLEQAIQLGGAITDGVSCIGNPELGRLAGLHNSRELSDRLVGADIVLIIVALGGGFGTGYTPEICKILRLMDKVPIAIATLPASFEGESRMDRGVKSYERIKNHAPSIAIEVEKFANEEESIEELFSEVDEEVTSLVTEFVSSDFESEVTISAENEAIQVINYQDILNEIVHTKKK